MILNQSKKSIVYFLFYLSILVLVPLMAFPQWPTFPGDNKCGNIIPQVSYCSASSNSFCIGDSVGFSSSSIGTIDSSFIAWGDGTIDIYSGNFAGCKYNKYRYRPDTCVPFGFLKVDIILGFYDTCAAGYSLNSFGTSIYIRFHPHAEFSFTPAIVCTDEPINFDISKSCANININANEWAYYSWDMGNGVVINDSTQTNILPPPIPNEHYSVPGNYTIKLTIRNNCATSVYTKAIKVLPPTKIFPSIVADTCAPTSFIPTMIDSNVRNLQWTSNLATFSNDTIRQPLVTVTPPGIYIFNVTATGCCFLPSSICSWSDTIKFDSGPWLNLQPAPTANT